MRRAKAVCVLTVIVLMSGWLAGTGSSTGQTVGGPLAVLGVDAEDGGVGAHGPVAVYIALITSMLGQVSNGGANLLVIGGGKLNLGPITDEVTAFWNAVDAGLPSATVTYVNGAPNIAAQSFDGFAMLAVVSSVGEAPDGGLTPEENAALTARGDDVAAFVNGGGGLIGLTQAEFPNPYLYLGDIAAITGNFGLEYFNITPTAEGLAVGITDALDVCCWHDEFTGFPDFLAVLATNAETGNAAALGGTQVVITSSTTSSSPSSTTATTSRPTTTTTLPGSPTANAVQATSRFVG